MFKVSLIVCVSLIFGITAKPYKPWNKLKDEAFHDTVMSLDDKGKMSWGVEVKPPKDVGGTHNDIDPRMVIWKSMTGREQEKQPPKAEEDLDDLYHPSVADLLKVRIQNLDVLSAADIQAEPAQEYANMKYEKEPDDHPVFSKLASEEPEQDWDEVYHKAREELYGYLVPLMADYKAGTEVRVAHSEPEKDEDDLYHRDDHGSPVQMELLRRAVWGESEGRVHLQPEEDMDDLYHQDPLQSIPYQDNAQAAAPVDLPSQRKHSEPEEDLDDLYHQ
ncbi:uncharacterized protein si:ch211-217g15.3 [Xiphias gladius]|uniref:uncharacterized protein si:ch211-217g15.3 n=1 Tax=Xiphias gladius TaxID=8245 RepID=UPI001A98B8CA|nr:uncharacterized protein si:ch211-217g15.3 [Xiphias gladius]XP_039994373.1 uncharacterized protein si:ch211-217g15.3 [Xiphias gladius]